MPPLPDFIPLPETYWNVDLNEDDPQAAAKAEREGAQEALDEYHEKLATYLASLGLKPNPDPRKALMADLMKPETDAQAQMIVQQAMAENEQNAVLGQPPKKVPLVFSWEEQRSKLPWSPHKGIPNYRDSLLRYVRLRLRASNDELGQALKAAVDAQPLADWMIADYVAFRGEAG